MSQEPAAAPERESLDFIREIVRDDLQSGKHPLVVTRFPPEPNGYLHIGHAKSICLNFGLGLEHAGSRTHLRFDDTNPVKEDIEYVNSIMEDVRWLGFDWGEHLYHASDYFDQIHAWALELIGKGLAYVCDQTAEEIRAFRGTLTEAGRNSPHRDRSVEENFDLFSRMRAGEFAEGSRTLRAKIDMAAPNINLRDPVLYRIKKVPHDRTGDKWCIYPTYDMAHGYSDAIEGITHSICTLEFEAHRPLYEWLIDNVSSPHRPRQIEFARLNLTYTVMSKRKLLELVESGLVDGWDDPRMPTISGLRRRGFSPEGIRSFCHKIGVTKFKSMTDVGLLEHAVREELNKSCPRYMGVLRPLKVTITNWPAGHTEDIEAVNNPEDPSAGSRIMKLSGELFIEQDDFMEDPPPKYFRLGPGREVRLRYAYNIKCNEVIKDSTGKVIELRCTYDPDSRHSSPKKGSAVIHWISAPHAASVEVRLYDRLFNIEDLDDIPEGKDYRDFLNPDSLTILHDAKVEPLVKDQPPGARFQFERMGYFCIDTKYSKPGAPVVNRAVTLKDTWAKVKAKG
ncbi:MAG TPA: glutamine--tRNA ligase/YqeY domain fusion protein [Verrucomicrobiales bacterium]|nr:glutamine--tRNA ligase/YqeY domain fusion protein [Verrucomicrobiales bacterium]